MYFRKDTFLGTTLKRQRRTHIQPKATTSQQLETEETNKKAGRDRQKIDIEQTLDDLQCSASLSVNHDTSSAPSACLQQDLLSSDLPFRPFSRAALTLNHHPSFEGEAGAYPHREVKPPWIQPTFVLAVNFNNQRLLARLCYP